MALTLADVPVPNRRHVWAGTEGDLKYVVKDVTFDNDYDGTEDGEVVTAAQLGYKGILAAQVLQHAKTSDNESLCHTEVVPNSTFSQASVRLYQYDGDSTGVPVPFTEAPDAFNASGFTARVKFYVF
jgi:hypothetical protein